MAFSSCSSSPSRFFCLRSSSLHVARIHSSSAKRDSTAAAASAASVSPLHDDPTERPSPPSAKIVKLVDEISKLTLLEVSQLTDLLREKLNIPAMPPMGMMMPMGGGMMPGGAAGGAAAAAEEKPVEKTEFDVKLEKFAAESKIKIIKEVRSFTSLGLKEAKELVEKAPIVIKKGVNKDEANEIVEKLKALGGTCALE
ncbi:hypothetical protein CBR_g2871 [Chara braunii]|uniref:Ribosomal protein L7/L12 C-terminal domain-containing protein n=1 Tax=Chara braunii TaxID=69332 RepID=A0A388KE93_CHABU|nr:hypothetical protein CBR_g2871 [Chara braunii]|eukprot:GBG68327.1 hypothetical protein CBR_g2871 [Chara braunii]